MKKIIFLCVLAFLVIGPFRPVFAKNIPENVTVTSQTADSVNVPANVPFGVGDDGKDHRLHTDNNGDLYAATSLTISPFVGQPLQFVEVGVTVGGQVMIPAVTGETIYIISVQVLPTSITTYSNSLGVTTTAITLFSDSYFITQGINDMIVPVSGNVQACLGMPYIYASTVGGAIFYDGDAIGDFGLGATDPSPNFYIAFYQF